MITLGSCQSLLSKLESKCILSHIKIFTFCTSYTFINILNPLEFHLGRYLDNKNLLVNLRIVLKIHMKMSPLKTNPFQENNTCPGIQENSIIPILLSSLSTTELCLMFLIERDKADQNIYYRSRNCDKVLQNGLFCPSCQELFDNLNHFHHIQLKKSCK